MSDSIKKILSKYGNILNTGTGLLNEKREVLKISPSIDFALGGGIPEGSLVSLTGPPGCGKSSTALQIAARAIEPQYNVNGAKRKIFYLDVEHRIKAMNVRGIAGLTPDDIHFIRSTKERILSAEDFLDIAEQLIKDPDNEGAILVLDSSSALCPTDELVKDTSGSLRTTQPKLMSHWCKKIASPIKVMNVTTVLIQHLITNTSGYGEKWLTDGGEKIKYHLDIKLLTKGKPEKWMNKETQVGQIIDWEVIKSANSASTGEVKSYLRFGAGLDRLKEAIMMAVDFGIINKAGAWFSMTKADGTLLKYQGEEKLYEGLANDQEANTLMTKSLETFIYGTI